MREHAVPERPTGLSYIWNSGTQQYDFQTLPLNTNVAQAESSARAIETGCFVLAPAQTGFHAETQGKGRRTHGHSLAVAPWGEVIADGGTDPGITLVKIDLAQVKAARDRVPSLSHDRDFQRP